MGSFKKVLVHLSNNSLAPGKLSKEGGESHYHQIDGHRKPNNDDIRKNVNSIVAAVTRNSPKAKIKFLTPLLRYKKVNCNCTFYQTIICFQKIIIIFLLLFLFIDFNVYRIYTFFAFRRRKTRRCTKCKVFRKSNLKKIRQLRNFLITHEGCNFVNILPVIKNLPRFLPLIKSSDTREPELLLYNIFIKDSQDEVHLSPSTYPLYIHLISSIFCRF